MDENELREAVSELWGIAACIHTMLKEGDHVGQAYIEDLGDALEGVNMVTGWQDQFASALAKQLSRLT